MPEKRYVEEYKDGKLVKRVPYEVSDEVLQGEADEARLKEILALDPPAMTKVVIAEGFKLLCKRLEITSSIEGK